MTKKPVKYVAKDPVFPFEYKANGYAKLSVAFIYNNPEFLKFFYTFARHLPGINIIFRLAFPLVYVAWRIWYRKTDKLSPASPNESLTIDPRITRLIRAIATAITNDNDPEDVSVKTMALVLALLRLIEDGTIYEASDVVPKVYALAEVYVKYLKGEVGDEELTGLVGSVQLPMLPTVTSTTTVTGGDKNGYNQTSAKTGNNNSVSGDGVFAKILASLMFSTTPKQGNY